MRSLLFFSFSILMLTIFLPPKALGQGEISNGEISNGELSDGALAETIIDKSILQSLAMTYVVQPPTMFQPGVQISPTSPLVTTIRAGLNASDYNRGSSLAVLLGIDVSANAQADARRFLTNVSVGNSYEGHFLQALNLDPSTGMQPGTFYVNGTPQLAVTGISSSGLFKRIGARMAARMANEKAPEVVNSSITMASETAAAKMREYQAKIQTLMQSLNNTLPTNSPSNIGVQFATRNDGFYSALVDKNAKNAQGAASTNLISLAPGQASKTVISEKVLAATLGPVVAGKEIRIKDLHEYLCGPLASQFLNFCHGDIPDAAKNLSVVFDKQDPLKLHFQNGKITLELNGRFRVYKTGAEPPPSVPLSESSVVQDAADCRDCIETKPTTMEITYRVSQVGAKLEDVSIKTQRSSDSEPTSTSIALPLRGDSSGSVQSSHSSPLGLLASSFSTATRVLGDGANAVIEKAMLQQLKKNIAFDPFTIPSNTTTYGEAPGSPTVINDGMTFSTTGITAKDGLLTLTTSMTQATNPVVTGLGGIGLSLTKEPQSGFPHLTVSSVPPNTPAGLSGLKPGDRIVKFQGADGKQTVLLNEQPFLIALGQKAAEPDPENRRMTVTVERQGKSEDVLLHIFPDEAVRMAQARSVYESATNLANRSQDGSFIVEGNTWKKDRDGSYLLYTNQGWNRIRPPTSSQPKNLAFVENGLSWYYDDSGDPHVYTTNATWIKTPKGRQWQSPHPPVPQHEIASTNTNSSLKNINEPTPSAFSLDGRSQWKKIENGKFSYLTSSGWYPVQLPKAGMDPDRIFSENGANWYYDKNQGKLYLYTNGTNWIQAPVPETTKTVAEIHSKPTDPASTISVDSTWWKSDDKGTLSYFKENQWYPTEQKDAELAKYPAGTEITSKNGVIWIRYKSGSLYYFSDGQWIKSKKPEPRLASTANLNSVTQ